MFCRNYLQFNRQFCSVLPFCSALPIQYTPQNAPRLTHGAQGVVRCHKTPLDDTPIRLTKLKRVG